MMSDARKRKLDMVLVWRWDRFARSTRFLLLALEEFRALKIQFVSFQEDIDTGTPIGQVLFTLIAAMAELERNLIVERVCAGIRNARAKGKRLRRPQRSVDQDRLMEMQASGMSLRQIAATLKIGYGTVRARLQSSERKTPGKTDEEIAPFTGKSTAV
jgi:DNA invertase Pin-like site-specific DNA recombinase